MAIQNAAAQDSSAQRAAIDFDDGRHDADHH
jgi:hypothetical protein